MLKAFLKIFNIEEALEAHMSWNDMEAQKTWKAHVSQTSPTNGRPKWILNRYVACNSFLLLQVLDDGTIIKPEPGAMSDDHLQVEMKNNIFSKI